MGTSFSKEVDVYDYASLCSFIGVDVKYVEELREKMRQKAGENNLEDWELFLIEHIHLCPFGWDLERHFQRTDVHYLNSTCIDLLLLRNEDPYRIFLAFLCLQEKKRRERNIPTAIKFLLQPCGVPEEEIVRCLSIAVLFRLVGRRREAEEAVERVKEVKEVFEQSKFSVFPLSLISLRSMCLRKLDAGSVAEELMKKSKEIMDSYVKRAHHCGASSSSRIVVGRFLCEIVRTLKLAKKEGIKILHKAIDLNPTIETLFQLSYWLEDEKAPEHGVKVYYRCREMDKTYVLVNNNIGAYHKRQSRFTEAIEYFKEELEYHPLNHYAARNAGECYKRIGDGSQALDMYKLSTTLNPHYAYWYDKLSDSYLENRDPRRAMICARKAVKVQDRVHSRLRIAVIGATVAPQYSNESLQSMNKALLMDAETAERLISLLQVLQTNVAEQEQF